MTAPAATIIITTKNRKDELRKAILSAMQQTIPNEIIVLDDASTDGTSEMIRAEFPQVKLHRSEKSEGAPKQRNRGAQMASAPILFSLDDDATFMSPHVTAQTLTQFDDDRIAAVAIPFSSTNRPDVMRHQAPDDRQKYALSQFFGCAVALRRDVFLNLGGYREILFYYEEETDYCVRLLEAGYYVRMGRSDPVFHFESVHRSHKGQVVHVARNQLLYVWHNVPMPYMPLHMMGTCVQLLRFGFRSGHLAWVIEGIIRGFGISMRRVAYRRPVRISTYRLSRILRKRDWMPLSEVEPFLCR